MDSWWSRKIVTSKYPIHTILVDDSNTLYYSSDDGVFRQPLINHPQRQLLMPGEYQRHSTRGLAKIGNMLYVTDMYKHVVRQCDLGTRFEKIFAGVENSKGSNDGRLTHQRTSTISDQTAQFCFPWAIIADQHGDLLITDDHRVRKLDMIGRMVYTLSGSYGEYYSSSKKHVDGDISNARFQHPAGLAVTSDGTIYVCDCFNHCIRKIKNNYVTTIAGSPMKKGLEDGPLKSALFESPKGLALMVDGNLVVTDESGLRFLNLELGTVSTKLGSYRCVCADQFGNLYVGTNDGVLQLNPTWKLERLLWIAIMKEDASSCLAASLPKDIVREIAVYIRHNTYRVNN